ncbi:tRNA-2-methylthio-N(6)-dimethylallyladenosine synthase [Larimichthys crocea]|uniref:Uncharacterized protein n=1 Tax=Larimichthys crocea TaxID=215358 RepID=A0ACD3RHS3_LARCR|nr:tRNA-2-methylthio-N(6)-dimethylallyladenosine synthase [Larimichthys crocea]
MSFYKGEFPNPFPRLLLPRDVYISDSLAPFAGFCGVTSEWSDTSLDVETSLATHGMSACNDIYPTQLNSDNPLRYTRDSMLADKKDKMYFETYGCQMNVNDTEIAWSILQRKGYQRTADLSEADVVLLVTCSIREKAEQTIWNRLQQLTAMKKRRLKTCTPMKIGILGCMAERLKVEILEREKLVDVLAGPDAYRDLPRLLTIAEGGQQASNVLLSLEETYADVMPVQHAPQGLQCFCVSCSEQFWFFVMHVTFLLVSFLHDSVCAPCAGRSIMRGCDNMCSYCIVPFTRGRERSRPVSSILEEVRMLSDQVLHLIAERKNICQQIHLPAQSGSSKILKAMRRGYTREAYFDLVRNIKTIIPEVSLSSDFISGFCGETEDDHQQTLSLIREVGYNVGFLFAYSMRKKTHAFHRLQDDVPAEVKQQRLEECISVFREEAAKVNGALVGGTELVLVEGESKRSAKDLCGRTDGNMKVIFPKEDVAVQPEDSYTAPVNAGDYVLVKISSANSQSLRGRAISHSSLGDPAKHYETVQTAV